MSVKWFHPGNWTVLCFEPWLIYTSVNRELTMDDSHALHTEIKSVIH